MKKNLVLIGMMGSGKSTIGKEISKKSTLKFKDTDQLIENNQYCSFIIKTDSLGNSLDEKYFNKINSNKIYDVEINNNIILGIGNTELVDTTKIFVVKINNMID